MRKIATLALVFATVALASPAAFAHSGSSEDQAACTPDVFRLCRSEIPSESRIIACMIKHKAELSPVCKAVFSRKK